MSRTTKFTFSYARTVQMRRYETVNVFLSAETELDLGESMTAIAAKVKKQIRGEVEDEITRLKRERREAIDDELEKTS